MPKISFTKSSIEKLPHPTSGWKYYQDDKTPGLAIGIGANGTKTFVFYKRINGTPERIKIGRYPDFTIEQARRKAMELNGQIASGRNPAEAKREQRNEITLQELFKLYIEHHAIAKQKRTATQMTNLFDSYLGHLDAPKKKHGRKRVKPQGSVDWSNRRISTIKPTEVSKLHHNLGQVANKRTLANRVIELLRAIFNRCKALKFIDIPNPAEGITPYDEVARDRFLSQNEIPKFFEALMEESEQNRDFFLLSLYTGARKSNVLSMRWQDIDANAERWRVPGAVSKNKKQMYLPLTQPALTILRRRSASSTTTFVFPGAGKTGHMSSPKRAWARILEKSGLQDIRPHDLRHSLASWMVNTGASLPIIGGALGHKDIKSTQVYAHLMTDPVKDAMEKAQNVILGLAEEHSIEETVGEHG